MICLSCTGSTIRADIELININRDYIDLVEIRADFLEPAELDLLSGLPGMAGLPCILTFRKPEDGGVSPVGGDDSDFGIEDRASILSAALSGGWAYIDIEDDADSDCERQLVRDAEALGTRVIKSFHDFSGVPSDLAARLIDISCGDRFIPKAAVMPADTSDLIKIIDAHREIARLKLESKGYSCTNGPFLSDYILLGMGAVGFPSRIMAGAWGGMLTFCSAGGAAAPGHIGPKELALLYNYRNLTSRTKVFGIVGNPVMHTKSPALHNSALQKLGIDGVYLPFETSEPEVILNNTGKFNLFGLSVTIPHKQRVIDAALSVDDAVKAIGACNTLVSSMDESADKSTGWHGYNTDWKGFLAPIENEFGGSGSLAGRSALVIGAGGAARSVVYALVKRGMDVMIVNRTAEKAEMLAARFGCRGMGLPQFEDSACAGEYWPLVVQTTSVGMAPAAEYSPVPGFDFSTVEIAYDIIYVPEKTVFLSDAEKAGCRIINGMPMLRAQAAEQFRLFTGKPMV